MTVASNGGGGDALDATRHMRYFQRCFRTMLPRQYTGNDSTRMTLGFFIIAAMDLLTPARPATAAAGADSASPPKPADPLTNEDRHRIRDWVLAAQHTHGGFCGSPTHVLPAHEYDDWDFESASPCPGSPGSANIAATAFALLLLALIADPAAPESALAGVRRTATLRWLRKLQRPDGSFGEVLVEMTMPAGRGETIAGGRDMRYCYIAAMIRWMLRGDISQGDPGWVEDIDVEALASYIRKAQTFDGGVGESSMHESHAGYAYCAVSALSLLERPAEGPWSGGSHCSMDVASLLRFLASRQLAYQDPQAAGDGDGDEDNFPQPSALSRDAVAGPCPEHVGLNGRCNKVADTCYTWWVAGTLDCLRRDQSGGGTGPDVDIARKPARRFLLEKTQHIIGGFSKNPGGPPDVYHAYLGLAALAAMGEPGLKGFDVTLCVSSQIAANIEAGRRGLLKRYSAEDNNMSSDNVVRLGELMAGCEAEKLVGDGAGLEAAEDGRLLERLLSRRMQMTRA